MDKPTAKDSYRERAAQNRRRVKRFKSPDVTKLYGLAVPDLHITGKYCQYYFRTKKLRNEAKIRFVDAKEINPKKL